MGHGETVCAVDFIRVGNEDVAAGRSIIFAVCPEDKGAVKDDCEFKTVFVIMGVEGRDRTGHQMMGQNPYAGNRYLRIGQHDTVSG